MEIRRATINDLEGINTLLSEVLEVHHQGRPDLFKTGVRKYTDEELIEIINDDHKPIFVLVDNDKVLCYAFTVIMQYIDHNIFTDIKTLYIDDLCTKEEYRGKGYGKMMYDYVLNYAKNNGFYNLTLNVWSCNESAMKFYEKCGLKAQKVGMEVILQ